MKSTDSPYIQVTQAFLRFYVLSSRYLDHRLGTMPADFLSHEEVHSHLEESRDALLQLVAINRIVPGKVEKEFEEIARLGRAVPAATDQEAVESAAIAELQSKLKQKMAALSDLLAVLRLV